MDYKKIKETIITIIIPLATTIILSFSGVLGKEYLNRIILITVGVVLFLLLLYIAFNFLQDRERRWEGNKEVHNGFREKIMKLENDNEKILNLLKTNEKINILEERISYLEGRIKK